MNLEEQQYLDILKDIRSNGVTKQDRTGVGNKYKFGCSMRFNLKNSFPLLTTKKMFLKGIVEELLFFLSGNTDTKILEKKGVNIWKGNTSREFLDKINLNYLPEGDLGCSYSHQWRNFGGEHPLVPETKGNKGFDQVKYVIDTLKKNPLDRRLIISGWAPNQMQFMALPPCHLIYIFSVNPETNRLNCHMTQRSCDFFLGVPFNIASTALMTILFAEITRLKPGEVFWTGTDCHIYLNHLSAVEEQISRTPYEFPEISILKRIESLEDIIGLNTSDFKLENYKYHPSIFADMAI